MTDTPTQPTTDRRTVLKRSLAGGIAGLAGCLSGDGEEAEQFRIAAPWEADMDAVHGGSVLRRLGITETLVGVDYDATLTPELATEWDSDENGRAWRFRLRDDVTFHDGEPLDAAAAVTSLRRAVESPAFADVPIESVEAIDESTVGVTTATPLSPLPAHLSRADAVILSPNAYGGDDVASVIGTGPFEIESWESSTDVRTVRNDEYYGATPAIETVRYETVEDDQTRRFKLENEELDMARILPLETVDALESDPGIDVHTHQVPRCRFVVFDNASSPFDDIRVRQALNHAVDREAIVESLLAGIGEPAVGPFPPSIEAWRDPELEGYSHDLDRARTLLSEAGWSNDAEGELRRRDGEDLTIELMTYGSRPLLSEIAEVLQDQFGTVGVDVDLTVMEYTAMMERARREAFDCYLLSMSMLWYPDPERLRDVYHSEGSMLNHGYANDDVDELLAAGRETTDRSKRVQRYRRIQSIVLEDAPLAYLTYYTNVIATTTNVQGYEPHPIETSYGLGSVDVHSAE